MKTILKDYIGYFTTPSSQAMISYLELEIITNSDQEETPWTTEMGSNVFNNVSSSYSKIGLTTKSLFVQTESHRVSSTMNPEMVKDIQRLHGIDMNIMLQSTLENEMERMTEKKLLRSIEDESNRN